MLIRRLQLKNRTLLLNPHRPQPLLQLRQRHGTGNARHFFALPKQYQRRNAANRPALGDARCGFGIEFCQAEFRLQQACRLLKHRRETFTGAAPWRPTIHQHGNVIPINYRAHIAGVQLHGLARKQGFLAFAALRFIAEALVGHTVGGVAIGAGDLDQAHVTQARCAEQNPVMGAIAIEHNTLPSKINVILGECLRGWVIKRERRDELGVYLGSGALTKINRINTHLLV